MEWRFLTDGPWIAEQIAGLNRILRPGFAVGFLCAQDFSAGESAPPFGGSAHMNRLLTIPLLMLALFLTGCAKSDVKYSDLRPATSATVSDGVVTVHVGSDLTASACWTRVKSSVEGSRIYLVGYRTMREQSREVPIRLPGSTKADSVEVVWVDPDGTQVRVPTSK